MKIILAIAIAITFVHFSAPGSAQTPASSYNGRPKNATIALKPGNPDGIGAGHPGLIDVPVESYINTYFTGKHTTGKTYNYSVSGAAFFPEAPQAYSRNPAGGNVFVPDGTAGAAAHLIAPVQLPDDALITGVTFYVLDDDPVRDLPPAQLWRQSSGRAGTSEITVTGPSSGASTTVQALSQTLLADARIDNLNNSYFLRFSTWQKSERFYLSRALITYVIVKAN